MLEQRKVDRSWQQHGSPSLGLLLAAPLIVLGLVFVAVPVIAMVWKSLAESNGLDTYVNFFKDDSSRRTVLTTVVMSLAVTVSCTVVGTVLAWSLRTSTKTWWKALIWAAIIIPLWMGVVVKNYAFGIIFGGDGVLNKALSLIPGVDGSTSFMYTNTAVFLGVTYSMIPFATLPIYVAFRGIDLDLVRAGRSLGASTARIFQSVVLPLATPGIAAGFVVVFLVSVGFYVTPLLLGGASSPFVATVINQDIFKYYDQPHARVASVVLIIISIIVLLIVGFLSRWKPANAVKLT